MPETRLPAMVDRALQNQVLKGRGQTRRDNVVKKIKLLALGLRNLNQYLGCRGKQIEEITTWLM